MVVMVKVFYPDSRTNQLFISCQFLKEEKKKSLNYDTTHFPKWSKIIFGGTHLCHEFEENRIAQAKQVASITTTKAIPAIILGDFNITPDSKPYKAITAK